MNEKPDKDDPGDEVPTEEALRESEEQYRIALKNSPITLAHVDTELRYTWIANPHPDFDPATVVGKRDDELDSGPGIEALVKLKQRALERGEQERQEITFIRSDGEHTYDITITPVRDGQGNIQKLITAAVEITPRKKAQEALRQSEARLAQEVAALRRLHQMTGRVVTVSDRQQALDEILNASLEILQADFGDIQLFDQESQALVIVAQHGFEQSFLDKFHQVRADDDTSCGRALRYGRRVVIADVAADTAYAPYLEAVREAGYRAVQSTPLVNHLGQVMGVLSTQYRQPTTLTERDEQLLDLLAYQAANLLERLRTEDRLEKRVQQRTSQVYQLASELITTEQSVRRHLAQTLHDDLQQVLYAANIQLDFLRDNVGEKDELNETVKTIRQAITLTRQLTGELSPPMLEGEGLPETLTWLAHHMADVYQLQVTIEVNDQPQTIGEEQWVLLYRIVRELLFNVVKHAGVQEAQASLQEDNNGITVTISDHGRGFDVKLLAEARQNHFGLRSIQERLQYFGGRANIESRPGGGTRVTLFLPHMSSSDKDGAEA